MSRCYPLWCSMICTMVLMLGSVWTHVVSPAREAARRVRCHNELFQHSGCHSDSVTISTDGKVLSVTSCPLCGSVAPRYFDSDGREFLESDLSLETRFEAAVELLKYKSSKRYRELYICFHRSGTHGSDNDRPK